MQYYLGTGDGRLNNPTAVPEIRTGEVYLDDERQQARRGVPMTFDLGDLNGDAALDIVVGWQQFGTGNRNLRLLFGGVR
jgi:hypothetical protein